MDKKLQFEELQDGTEMTLEKLAHMTAKGFMHVDHELRDIKDTMLAEHRRRIEHLEQELQEMKKALAM